jgi:hypothetical protein
MKKRPPRPEEARLDRLAADVAEACNFGAVPPVRLRRGSGGDWSPERGKIRLGADELRGSPERVWFLLAHELYHAQAGAREGHSMRFWRRLADGLKQTGRLELIKYDIGYREGALQVAHEYGLAGIPAVANFSLGVGEAVVDREGRRWVITRRRRRGGRPYYHLKSPGWVWTAPEGALLKIRENGGPAPS